MAINNPRGRPRHPLRTDQVINFTNVLSSLSKVTTVWEFQDFLAHLTGKTTGDRKLNLELTKLVALKVKDLGTTLLFTGEIRRKTGTVSCVNRAVSVGCIGCVGCSFTIRLRGGPMRGNLLVTRFWPPVTVGLPTASEMTDLLTEILDRIPKDGKTKQNLGRILSRWHRQMCSVADEIKTAMDVLGYDPAEHEC